jgi:hypothetical protein
MIEDNLTNYFKEVYSDKKNKIKLLRNVHLHVSICLFLLRNAQVLPTLLVLVAISCSSTDMCTLQPISLPRNTAKPLVYCKKKKYMAAKVSRCPYYSNSDPYTPHTSCSLSATK